MNARALIEAKVFGQPSGLYTRRGQPQDGREHVVAAALRDPTTGDIFLEDYHLQAGEEFLMAHDGDDQCKLGVADLDHGFWTSASRFVWPREVFGLARKARQDLSWRP